MFNSFINKIKKRYNSIAKVDDIKKSEVLFEEIKIQNGKILSLLHQQNYKAYLSDIKKSEFKVFSQWNDDGIIQFLVNYLAIEHKIFIEFGVENYKESNTRFLLINNNWKGLIIDGSKKNIDFIKNDYLYWQYDLTAVNQFVTKENINSILEENGFKGEIGLLHIDIDGNDYWVWKELHIINPVIVIIEYNSTFGNSKAWTIPYDKDFFRTNLHYSNLYYGASVAALCNLAIEKGYQFIGCNSNGNNAYFVRNDKIKELQAKTAAEGYVEAKFRETRSESGELTYSCNNENLNAIKGMDVYNTISNTLEKI